ncbi:MAG: redoxin domain-containing protein [Dehalococcoidia bacterium]|nr:redoxin domain-containing protein [Dehalococcoidia bacterium]MDW8009725.1 redoxin domain-containing protein [Chloroflexota bacterium]
MSVSPGDRAPDFTLPSTRGTVALSELLSKGKVVLAFYFQDETPLCATQVGMLKGDFDLLAELGAQVVAISADDLESHRRFEERLGGLPFPLASDESLTVARAYGVVDETGKRCRRAIFVIDQDGTVLLANPFFQPNSPQQYQELFRALGLEA